jgi:hypothetical protein
MGMVSDGAIPFLYTPAVPPTKIDAPIAFIASASSQLTLPSTLMIISLPPFPSRREP